MQRLKVRLRSLLPSISDACSEGSNWGSHQHMKNKEASCSGTDRRYLCRVNRPKILLCISLSCLSLLCSCLSLKTKGKNGIIVSHHFGYTRVEAPPTISKNTEEEFKVNNIRTWGIRISEGVDIGYSHERNEYIPLDCRLVVHIANEEQLEKVLNILKDFEKEGLCLTVDGNN